MNGVDHFGPATQTLVLPVHIESMFNRQGEPETIDDVRFANESSSGHDIPKKYQVLFSKKGNISC